jgi:hypothetical protein
VNVFKSTGSKISVLARWCALIHPFWTWWILISFVSKVWSCRRDIMINLQCRCG